MLQGIVGSRIKQEQTGKGEQPDQRTGTKIVERGD